MLEDDDVHVASETVALAVVAPAALWIGLTNRELPRWQRWFLVSLAIGTVVVDGYLLSRKLRNR